MAIHQQSGLPDLHTCTCCHSNVYLQNPIILSRCQGLCPPGRCPPLLAPPSQALLCYRLNLHHLSLFHHLWKLVSPVCCSQVMNEWFFFCGRPPASSKASQEQDAHMMPLLYEKYFYNLLVVLTLLLMCAILPIYALCNHQNDKCLYRNATIILLLLYNTTLSTSDARA